jgi:hypothetical protein
MTVRQIVDALLAAKGITGVTSKQHNDLEASLHASLGGHEGKTVERVGEGIPMRWRVRA